MTFSAQQKRDWTERFNDVAELYNVLNEGRYSLRSEKVAIVSHNRRQATGIYNFSALDPMFNGVEVKCVPLDFLMDVELKAARVLPTERFNEFMRLADVSQLRLLPDASKLLLGKVWTEYNLGVDGAYSKLYYDTKNEQIRNYLKGKAIGDIAGTADSIVGSTVEPNQFN